MVPFIDPPGLVAALPAVVADAGPHLGRAFGKLHPLIVHFPIALALVAVAAEWWRSCSRQTGLSSIARPLLWIAGGTALVGSAAGWVNAAFEYGGEASATLDRHRWLGTGSTVAILALAWWCESLHAALRANASAALASLGSFRWASLVVAIAIAVTGHLGGDLVHGEGYLTDYLLPREAAETAPPKEAPAAEAAALTDEERFFVAEVRPILEAHCIECHGPRKQKGGLRMDSKAWMFNGAEEDRAVLPGRPEQSPLLVRVQLPREDPDAMPPEGGGLSDAEKATLRAWIERGAVYPESTPAAIGTAGMPVAAASAVIAAAGTVSIAGGSDVSVPPAVRAKADAAARALVARGVLVQPLAADSPLLDVSAMRAEPPIGDAEVALLADLAPVVVNLNLAKSALTDAGLAGIGPMPHLERLRLDGTSIGDAGVQSLGTLARLESINLVATKVTPASVEWFRAQPALRRIYVWQTGLDSPDAIGRLTEGSSRQAIGADLPLAEPKTPPMPEDPAPAPPPAESPKPTT